MNTSVWNMISESLDRGEAAVLLYVVESRGSSPGRQGFAMALNASGKMTGSIGGGPMEHRLVEKLRAGFEQNGAASFDDLTAPGNSMLHMVHDKDAGVYASGMICSGEQRIAVYVLRHSDRQTVAAIVECIRGQGSGLLRLRPGNIGFETANERTLAGKARYAFEQSSGDSWVFDELLGLRDKLFVVGGGHCSFAFSRIAADLNFHIEVFDDRPGLDTLEANNYAHAKHTLRSYSELESLIPEGDDVYVVIMTFGYKSDDVAVRAVMNKNFKYIGLLGSRKKIETMFAALAHDGVSPDRIRRIRAPIGVPIKSRSPEEIAISIAAEIIGVRNRYLP